MNVKNSSHRSDFTLSFPIDNMFKTHKPFDHARIVAQIHKILIQLNNDFDFGVELAREWAHYLVLLLQGHKAQLSDPYMDIRNYNVKLFSQSTPDLFQLDSLYMLDEIAQKSLPKSGRDPDVLHKSLFVTALGGTDTTFYKYFDHTQMLSFTSEFYSQEIVRTFKKYGVVDLIPRGFAAKKAADGTSITNAESMIIQAYLAGIRNVAIIVNAKTYNPINEYFLSKFKEIRDLTILVVAQPLLPRIRRFSGSDELLVSAHHEGTPGGHGHGFKYCLFNHKVQALIQQQDLQFFIFSNGDNSVVFNWGGEHYKKAVVEMQRLKKDPANENLRIGFFLVWENLRKGGFSFLLEDKRTGKTVPQIFEAELARQSGADIDQLKKAKGGYNTNVAVGIIHDLYRHLEKLPMVLKEKKYVNYTDYVFEASLATAMTTVQRQDGSSLFDKKSSINILGPKTARHQHWEHIALRKRDDLFAFHSSLYKTKRVTTAFGDLPVIYTERDARCKYPTLSGNWVDAKRLNTREFFEIFVNASFDIDEFYGTIHIDLHQSENKPRGNIEFQGKVSIRGDQNSTLCFFIPAGELWIVRDKDFVIKGKRTVTHSEIIVQFPNPN